VNHFYLLELVPVRNHITWYKTHLPVKAGFPIRLAILWKSFVFMSKFTLDHYSAIKDSLNIFLQ